MLGGVFVNEESGVPQEQLMEEVNRELPGQTDLFTSNEAGEYLSRMSNGEDLFFADGVVYTI